MEFAGNAIHGSGARRSVEAGVVPDVLDLDRYRVLLRRFLRRHRRDSHGLDDLVQEVLLRAFRNLSTLRDPSAVEGWLLRIAHNVAMDWYRRGQREETPASSLPRESPSDDEGSHSGDREGGMAPAREWADSRSTWLGGVRRALHRISRRDRAYLIAHYFVGLSCRQISQRTGITVANVKVRLHRARRNLRHHLPPEEEFRDWLALGARTAPAAPRLKMAPSRPGRNPRGVGLAG